MWEATIEGRKLNFHLAGINNQNFIMHDEETGTWWQQVTGEAILGPLKGRRLKSVFHDELTYQLWKQEQPGGRVLRPDDTSQWKEFSENWEEETGKMPVVTKADGNDLLAPRTIVMGLNVNGEAKAYPLAVIEKQKLVVDTLGGVPVMILLNEDGKSVRAFETLIDGRKAELFIKPDSSPQKLTDSLTGSEWDFNGRGVAGEFANRELKKVPLLKDYWFDWKIYNPRTQVYSLGTP